MKLSFAYITTSDAVEARLIGRALVQGGHAACVNIIPSMESIYIWEGRLRQEPECILIAKTTPGQEQAITDVVKSLHSYEVPCVIFLPAEPGNTDYAQWVIDSCTSKVPRST